MITAILRPGRRIRGREAAAILKRVLDHILMAWPQVQITLRGDSHFSAPEVHDLCDAYDVDFILGQANNKKLKALGAPLMEQAAALAQQTEEPVRLFTSFDYRAGSWSRPRIIIYKAEITQGKTNPRFVVTNIRNRTPKFLYEKVYCARGRMEGFIKNHKTFLHSDRTSCHRFPANQFRLFLHSAAYVLVCTRSNISVCEAPNGRHPTSIRSNSASSKSAPECGSKPPGFAFTFRRRIPSRT